VADMPNHNGMVTPDTLVLKDYLPVKLHGV